jgi:IS5 family transposase
LRRHYPKSSSKDGRPPYPPATMLRIHLLQQWFDLSDPAMEDALISGNHGGPCA